ncbi:MAG: cytochrome c [Rubrivivax sp.]
MTTSAVARWLAAAALLCGLPALASDPLRGSDLWSVHCQNCHGARGRPALPAAPDLSQPQSLFKPDLMLLASIRNGRGAMPAFQGLLRDRDILDIVAHMRTFR